MKLKICGLSLIAAFGLSVAADEGMVELCKAGIEGSALVRIYPRVTTARMNLICVDQNRMVATSFTPENATIPMPIVAIDGAKLVLTVFPMSAAARAGHFSITGGTMSEIDIGALANNGLVRGWYMTGGLGEPLNMVGKVDHKFPAYQDLPIHPSTMDAVEGGYDFPIPSLKDPKKMMKGKLTAIRVDDSLTFALSIDGELGGQAFHFLNGPAWDGSGRFNSLSEEFWFLRGYVVDEKTVAFYLIDPVRGLRGPFTGTKARDFNVVFRRSERKAMSEAK